MGGYPVGKDNFACNMFCFLCDDLCDFGSFGGKTSTSQNVLTSDVIKLHSTFTGSSRYWFTSFKLPFN